MAKGGLGQTAGEARERTAVVCVSSVQAAYIKVHVILPSYMTKSRVGYEHEFGMNSAVVCRGLLLLLCTELRLTNYE